jgi:hypothetical protein
MSDTGFASLGPTLLARKGGAKPAMRPQLPTLAVEEAEPAQIAEEQLEDLGWNDMGDADHDSNGGGEVVPIHGGFAEDETAPASSPIVRRQQRRLEQRVLADAVMTGSEDKDADIEAEDAEDDIDAIDAGDDIEPADAAAIIPLATKPRTPAAARPARSLAQPRRAAFTLRLDPERHLKLRLAATMQGVSAQALLTDALDAMLTEFADLDIIASHLKRH